METESRIYIPKWIHQDDLFDRIIKAYGNKKPIIDIPPYNVTFYPDNVRVRGSVAERKVPLESINTEGFFKLSISREEVISESAISGNATSTRTIKRKSISYEDDIRIDLSIITKDKESHNEIEVETMNPLKRERVVEVTRDLISFILRTRYYYTVNERNNALHFLSKEISNVLSMDPKRKILLLKDISDKPIDLEFNDISSLGFFSEKVYVTKKADGIRLMLLVHGGNAYFIHENNLMWISKNANTKYSFLIDGELYHKDSMFMDMILRDDLILTYYPFDIYAFTGHCNITDTLEKKLKCMSLLDGLLIGNINIKLKEFFSISPKDAFININRILDLKEDFKIDGLIFTRNRSHFKEITGEGIFSKGNSRKWKPREQLTIDFKILDDNKLGVIEKKEYKAFIVGGMSFSLRGSKEYKVGDIVEVGFYEKNGSLIPTFKRLRNDKVEPNNLYTAYKVYDRILHPITESQIRGHDIDNMRIYHRNYKEKLIKETIDSLPNIHEKYHIGSDTKTFQSLERVAQLKNRSSILSKVINGMHYSTNRNMIMLIIEFIKNCEAEDMKYPFYVIGYPYDLKDIKIFFPDISIYNLKAKKDIKDGKFNLISFTRIGSDNEKIQRKAFNANINKFLIHANIQNIEGDYFLHYEGELIYGIWDFMDIYIVGHGTDSKLYNAEEMRGNLKYFRNHYLNHALQGAVNDTFYCRCYSCQVEREILGKSQYRELIDKLSRDDIFSNTLSPNNTGADIGAGKGGDYNRWAKYGLHMVAYEPDHANYQELERRTRNNLRVITINEGVTLNTNTSSFLQYLGGYKIGMVNMFNSITFFYQEEKLINRLLDIISDMLTDNGIFNVIAVDGNKILNFLYSDNKENLTKFYINYIGDRKVEVSLGKQSIVTIREDQLESDLPLPQIEYLVDFEDLIMRLESRGFVIIKDEYQDKEELLTKDELIYSSFTRAISARKELRVI